MSYGIGNVVGGFVHALTPEQQIPYTLNRTYIEHATLRKILNRLKEDAKFHFSQNTLELGCGYGRNLPLLKEFTTGNLVGFERDTELHAIAKQLNPDDEVKNLSVDDYSLWAVNGFPFDLILTFTFLQHLNEDEMIKACSFINNYTRKDSIVIICEESDPSKSHQGCWSRSAEEYRKAIGNFKHLASYDRIVEATFPGRVSGQYHVYEKIS